MRLLIKKTNQTKMNLIQQAIQLFKLTARSLRTYRELELYNLSLKYMDSFNAYSLKIFERWEQKDLLFERDCPLCQEKEKKTILDKRKIDGTRYSQCGQCGFIFMDPMPEEEHYNDIYISGYDGLDEWWQNQKTLHNISEMMVDNYPPLSLIRSFKPTGIFLDFGCGTGWVLNIAKEYYDIRGIDIDPQRIATANTLLNQNDIVKNFKEIIPDQLTEAFDVIHSNQNLEHLMSPLSYLRLFYKWLKPEGILFFSCPAGESFAFSFLKEHNSMAAISHVSLFTKKSVEYALNACGFELLYYRQHSLDVSAIEFWNILFKRNFVHRHSFVKNNILYFGLYPIMFLTTAVLYGFHKFKILKGNYFYCIAKKVRRL